MATYAQLIAQDQYDPLRQQVWVAVLIEAQAFIVEASSTNNHAARLAWAVATSNNVGAVREQILWLILAANVGLTVAQIQTATDAAVQGQVHSIVLGIVGG